MSQANKVDVPVSQTTLVKGVRKTWLPRNRLNNGFKRSRFDGMTLHQIHETKRSEGLKINAFKRHSSGDLVKKGVGEMYNKLKGENDALKDIGAVNADPPPPPPDPILPQQSLQDREFYIFENFNVWYLLMWFLVIYISSVFFNILAVLAFYAALFVFCPGLDCYTRVQLRIRDNLEELIPVTDDVRPFSLRISDRLKVPLKIQSGLLRYVNYRPDFHNLVSSLRLFRIVLCNSFKIKLLPLFSLVSFLFAIFGRFNAVLLSVAVVVVIYFDEVRAIFRIYLNSCEREQEMIFSPAMVSAVTDNYWNCKSDFVDLAQSFLLRAPWLNVPADMAPKIRMDSITIARILLIDDGRFSRCLHRHLNLHCPGDSTEGSPTGIGLTTSVCPSRIIALIKVFALLIFSLAVILLLKGNVDRFVSLLNRIPMFVMPRTYAMDLRTGLLQSRLNLILDYFYGLSILLKECVKNYWFRFPEVWICLRNGGWKILIILRGALKSFYHAGTPVMTVVLRNMTSGASSLPRGNPTVSINHPVSLYRAPIFSNVSLVRHVNEWNARCTTYLTLLNTSRSLNVLSIYHLGFIALASSTLGLITAVLSVILFPKFYDRVRLFCTNIYLSIIRSSVMRYVMLCARVIYWNLKLLLRMCWAVGCLVKWLLLWGTVSRTLCLCLLTQSAFITILFILGVSLRVMMVCLLFQVLSLPVLCFRSLVSRLR
jgi:hypothetical protein